MYSEKAKKNADACRFCWMCRHLCPVQLVTGKETNTPRAKGLQVSMEERGFQMDAAAAKTMYECLLCGSCTNDCVTGFEPPVFIREGRSQAIVNDLAPDCVLRVVEKEQKTGNIYGEEKCKVNLQGVPEKGDTLVWLGATARYSVPETAEALLSLFKKAGVNVAVLANEPASGSALGDLMGFVEDVRTEAKKAGEAIAASGAKKLVVLDSYDAALFRHEYKDWGVELPEVVTATTFVDELVKAGKLTPKQEKQMVTYHDGSRLARDLDEHQPARDLLAAMGCELHEMFLNRRLSRCCGSAVFGQYMPELRTQIAQNRWKDAQRTEAKLLVAACPQSTEAFSSTVPDGYQYMDLFVMLNKQC
ncbi:MAG: (Fe-S)-binding protein [Eubacteriales bacterium]|nr:(Fe-S)-binding protein [Eubacteriales bacterium]